MWHDVYREVVLAPDYEHARTHLLPHFFDALTAHAVMLDEIGVAHAAEAVRLLREVRTHPFPPYDPQVEDAFFAIDHALADRAPSAAGALRTALSRNDLDMTVYRLSAREQLLKAQQALLTLRTALLNFAAREIDTVIIAYTHHQPAQPTTLAHYLCGVENVLARDFERLLDGWRRLNLSPMGAVALAGSSFPIRRERTAQLLAFDRPVENTYDAVATSDWQVELAGAVATSTTTLSRVVHDLLLWASNGLLTLADGLVQGSSVMPQKRNPVALEHARTKLSKTLGHAQSVVYCAHNVPFGDINDPGPDMQPPLMALWREYEDALGLLTAALTEPRVNREAWWAQAAEGESALTELADEIARHTRCGFRAAHHTARELLAALREQGRPLSSAGPADLATLGHDVPASVIHAALDPRGFVQRRGTLGGPAPDAVRGHLELAHGRLERDTHARRALCARLADARRTLRGGVT